MKADHGRLEHGHIHVITITVRDVKVRAPARVKGGARFGGKAVMRVVTEQGRVRKNSGERKSCNHVYLDGTFVYI